MPASRGNWSSSRAELERLYDEVIAGKAAAKPLEMSRLRPDGTLVWVELRRHAKRVGDHWTIVTLVRDITDRKEAQDRIVYLNRVYAVLSGINSLIVRVRDRDELFREATPHRHRAGGFRLAWIGIVDKEAGMIKPVAFEGDGARFLRICPAGREQKRARQFWTAGTRRPGNETDDLERRAQRRAKNH